MSQENSTITVDAKCVGGTAESLHATAGAASQHHPRIAAPTRRDALADLERLAHWGCQTLAADRHELRSLLRAHVGATKISIRGDVIGGICDHVAAQYGAATSPNALQR